MYQFLKFPMVFSKSNLPMVILLVEEKISMPSFKAISKMNLKINLDSIFLKIKWLSKESEKPLKKLKLNSLLLVLLILTYLI